VDWQLALLAKAGIKVEAAQQAEVCIRLAPVFQKTQAQTLKIIGWQL
jgi:hypothetical protein